MRRARAVWLLAVLVVFAGCDAEPTEPDLRSIAGAWTATVRLATGEERVSMTLAHDAGTGGVTGSGLWVDPHRPPPLNVENLSISGVLASTTVTLILTSPAGAPLGTLHYSGSVVDDGEKMVGTLNGSRWSPPLRVEFSRP